MQVRDFLTSNFYVSDVAPLNDSESLLDLGVVDSTGVLEIVGFIEDTFDIRVEDNELIPENLDSIDRIANFVIEKTSG